MCDFSSVKKDKKKVIVIIIFILIIVMGIYVGYTFFINSEFDENMKLGLYYESSSDNKLSEAHGIINSTFSSEKEWDIGKNTSLIAFNDSIKDLEKSIYYRQKMLDAAKDANEKDYATLLLNYSNKKLQIIKLERDLAELVGYNYSFSNKAKYDEISSEKSKLVNEINTLIDELNLKSADFGISK